MQKLVGAKCWLLSVIGTQQQILEILQLPLSACLSVCLSVSQAFQSLDAKCIVWAFHPYFTFDKTHVHRSQARTEVPSPPDGLSPFWWRGFSCRLSAFPWQVSDWIFLQSRSSRDTGCDNPQGCDRSWWSASANAAQMRTSLPNYWLCCAILLPPSLLSLLLQHHEHHIEFNQIVC